MTTMLYRLRWAMTSTILLLAGTVSSAGQACPTFGFTSAPSPATGTYPASLVTSDFNGDGIADLATANYVSENVSVLLGTGGGAFAAAVNYANPGNPYSIAAGDLNNDGNSDLVTSNLAASTLTVWLGNGLGGFSSAGNYAVGSLPFGVYVKDLNGDGNADLVAANYGSDNVSVLIGNGTGGFGAASSVNSGSTPIAVAFGDFDLNGTVDLAVLNINSNAFSVLSGNGNGTFGAPTTYSVGAFPQAIATGDFNGDGRVDLVAANSSASTVSVRLNLATGGFAPAVNLATGNTPSAIAVADLDMDGNQDIVTANFFSSNASLLLGMGTGQFYPATNLSTGSDPGGVAIADLNSDGSPDFAVGNTGSGNISIFLNNCSGNSAPTVTASPVSRQKGAEASRSLIGTVNDAEQPESELIVTVNGGTSATVNGVSLTNLSVNSDGGVYADVSAACGASNASFTLRVTDGGGLSAETSLNVSVTASGKPAINVKAPISLFPHNGKMRLVSMSEMLESASDDCDGDLSSAVVIEEATSDEPHNDSTDIEVASDRRSVYLRASRDNRGDGRVYSVRLRATDSDGNTATAEFKATVPLGPNSGPAIEVSPNRSVTKLRKRR